MAQSDACPTGNQEVKFDPGQVQQHSFIEIDHEIFLVILCLLLIQEGQLSNSGKRMCTILVTLLED